MSQQRTSRLGRRSHVSTKKTPASRKDAKQLQYGALPYRVTGTRGIEFLLITSRETGRWIIPKGWPIEGMKPAKTAAREAYEEAGVRGIVSTRPIGNYSYEKKLNARGRTVPCKVTVFALLVRRQRRTWPEVHQRRTRWVRPRRALSLISEEELRSLISGFEKRAHAHSTQA